MNLELIRTSAETCMMLDHMSFYYFKFEQKKGEIHFREVNNLPALKDDITEKLVDDLNAAIRPVLNLYKKTITTMMQKEMAIE